MFLKQLWFDAGWRRPHRMGNEGPGSAPLGAFLLFALLIAAAGSLQAQTKADGATSSGGVASAARIGTIDSEPAKPPTVVLMIADDQDFRDFGFAGNPAAYTPTLDRLAREGTVFPVAHVGMSRCRPSLACLLAGTYPHQNGVYYNRGGPSLSTALDTLPRLLREEGYLCWLGGKFWEQRPYDLGFTHGRTQEARTFVRRDQHDLRRFLNQARDEPAFLWWAPLLPHAPFDPPQRFLDQIEAKKIPLPGYVPKNGEARWREMRRTVLAMGGWLDEGVSEMLSMLEEFGRLDNTLIVFLIDNGWSVGLPSKGTPYEHGFRTPVIVWEPGRIEAGTRIVELVSSLDIVPTVLDWANVPTPESFQGQSLWPLLEGHRPEWRDRLFGAAYPKHPSNPKKPRPELDVYALYVRTLEWKYVLHLRDISREDAADLGYNSPYTRRQERRKAQEELFDLQSDPNERRDLSADPGQRERVRQFRREVFEWWTATGGGPLPLGPEEVEKIRENESLSQSAS